MTEKITLLCLAESRPIKCLFDFCFVILLIALQGKSMHKHYQFLSHAINRE